MHDPGPTSVEAYLEQLPEDRVETMRAVIALVRETLDDVGEHVERDVVWWTCGSRAVFGAMCGVDSYALIPTDAAIRDAHLARLGRVRSSHGRILFRHLDDVEIGVVREMLRALATPERLGRRERAILRLLAQGRSLAQIGDDLTLGSGLVSAGVCSICRKLRARGTDDAIRAGRRHGYL